MPSRSTLRRFVPAHFQRPGQLALRLLRTGDDAALFAMKTAVLGALLTPLDRLLVGLERKLYAAATDERKEPLIFVCGPPRSGTTVVAQTLIGRLPVAYFSNLTSLFPCAPLTATRLFGRKLKPPPNDLSNYYGKSTGLSGANDALYIWDRWLGVDRSRVPDRLEPVVVEDIRRFFAACEAVWSRPLVNKCNSLNVCAHLVARALPSSYFICMTRDPVYLAQSLYKARLDIHGDAALPYGIVPRLAADTGKSDPIESTCEQVRYYERIAREQQERVGADRFWIVDYEEFCAAPHLLVERVRREILAIESVTEADPPMLRVSRGPTIDPAVFERFECELGGVSGRHGERVAAG